MAAPWERDWSGAASADAPPSGKPTTFKEITATGDSGPTMPWQRDWSPKPAAHAKPQDDYAAFSAALSGGADIGSMDPRYEREKTRPVSEDPLSFFNAFGLTPLAQGEETGRLHVVTPPLLEAMGRGIRDTIPNVLHGVEKQPGESDEDAQQRAYSDALAAGSLPLPLRFGRPVPRPVPPPSTGETVLKNIATGRPAGAPPAGEPAGAAPQRPAEPPAPAATAGGPEATPLAPLTEAPAPQAKPPGRVVSALSNAMPLTENAQARSAVARVRGAAADPAAMEANVRSAEPLVEGSRPTLAQVARDPGIDELERAERLKNPTVAGEGGEAMTFAGRAAEQNRARVEAIRSAAPASADPADIGRFVQRRLDEIDQMNDETLTAAKRHVAETTEAAGQGVGRLQGQAAEAGARDVGAARERLWTAAEAVGGTEAPGDIGQRIRDTVLVPARQALKSLADSVWNPLRERNPVLDATPAAQGAAAIEAKIPPGATRSAAERDLFNRAKGLDKPVGWEEFQQLRSELGESISDELAGGGKTPAWRRLMLLRGEMNRAMSSAAERTAAAEKVAPAGQVPAETLEQQWARERDEWRQRARSQEAATARGSLAAGDRGVASEPVGSRTISPGNGREVQAGREPANAPGSPGIQGQPLRLTWDEDAARQYEKARSLTANLKQKFARGAVGQALRESGWGNFKLADEQVVKRFLNNGPRRAADFDDYVKAVGDKPHAVQLLSDYAASELRRMAINRDGTVNARGLERFRQSMGQRLDAFPELKEKVANAESAQKFLDAETERTASHQALVDGIADGLRKSMPGGTWNTAAFGRWSRANEARLAEHPEIKSLFDSADHAQQTLEAAQKAAVWARSNFERSAAGNFLHSSHPAQTLGGILGRADALPQLQRMMIQLGGDDAAVNGLRSAMATHLLDRFATGLDTFGTGVNRLRGAELRKFFNEKRAAIETVMGPEGTKTIENVVRDYEREAAAIDRGKTTRGSDTELNRQAVAKQEGRHSLLHWLTSSARALPWVEALSGHPVLGLATFGVGALRKSGIAKRDALVSRMVLDPTFAKTMLEKYPARPSPAQVRALQGRLNAAKAPIGQADQQNRRRGGFVYAAA